MAKTLLLADDSVTIQKVVGITFANEDVELVTVDNGDDGLTRARQIRPDLVLADVSMPGLSGYELCSAIRGDADLATVPVLLLTGTFETYDAQRASDCGADGYIAKPFEAQALIERVRNLLERPRAPRAKPAAAPAAPQAPAPPAPVTRPAHGEVPTPLRPQPRPAQGEAPTPLRPQPRPAQAEVPTPLRVQQPPQATPPAPRAPTQTVPTAPAPRTPSQTGPTPPAPAAARPPAPPPAAPVPPPRPQGQPGQAAQPPAPRPPNPLPPAPAAPRPPVPATPPQAPLRPPMPPPGTGLTPARPPAPPAGPSAAPHAPASSHPAPASLSLNRGAPARPAFPSTPAEDALDEIPEEPLTVHTPPPGLHPEGVPRGATATRVMPPPELGDDEIFGEPIEEDDTSSTEGRTPQLGDDGAFEVEHPVRFNELGTPLDPSKSYGDLGQSFSISRETLTESDAPTAPRSNQAAARAPAPQADDDSDLPWAEPEPIELDQESDDTPDDSIEAARFAERMPSPPPPPPPVHDSPRPPARSAEDAPRRAAAPGSPVDSRAIHESLEKVAWEAFGPLSEQIMQEVVKRVEAIAWEVLPQLAERLIREEIAHLKKSGS